MKTASIRKVNTASGPLILVNADHPVSSEDRPVLVSADPTRPEILMERRAAGLLRACIQSVDGLDEIVPVSGWRSQKEQQDIWDGTMEKEGADFTRQYVAIPGCSEHQTGLAIDLGLAASHIDFIRPDFPNSGVCQAFRERCARYGFILRYPAGKEHITGISHEPWHFRYVGIPHAEIMTGMGLTLEEYLQMLCLYTPESPLSFRTGAYDFHIYRLDAAATFEPPEAAAYYQVSGDNCGGLIVTAWNWEVRRHEFQVSTDRPVQR